MAETELPETIPESPGEVSLHWLAAEGDHDKLEAALRVDRSALEITDRHGQTPLNLAARLGLYNIVKVVMCYFLF